jgi:hypothetical protein
MTATPIDEIHSLSEGEMNMTVEEWIRYEMGQQFERFKMDGERMIGMFKMRTSEVKQMIQAT